MMNCSQLLLDTIQVVDVFNKFEASKESAKQ